MCRPNTFLHCCTENKRDYTINKAPWIRADKVYVTDEHICILKSHCGHCHEQLPCSTAPCLTSLLALLNPYMVMHTYCRY